MQIIQALERSPRGVYTGAIGYFAPAGRQRGGGGGRGTATASAAPARPSEAGPSPSAVFNVAIRTVVLHGDGPGEMGVGSGIVHDSVAPDEYAECHLKARFLTEPPTDFALLETILWHGRYRRLDQHLRRMADSAAYFAYPYDRGRIVAALNQQANVFSPGQRHKIRLTLGRAGDVRCESSRIAESELPASGVATVVVCGERTDSRDPFVYHKTTHRVRYDVAHRQAVLDGHADALFLNERGEVTEGAISNIFVRRGTGWLTPPVHCGLLNGIYRQHVLRTRPNVREAVLQLHDLREADEIAICNAIRGWRRVVVWSDR